MNYCDCYYLFYRGAWEINVTRTDNNHRFKMLSELAMKFEEFMYDGYKIRLYYETQKQKNFILHCINFIKQKNYVMEILNEFEDMPYIITNHLNFFGSNKKITNCLEISRGIDENF